MTNGTTTAENRRTVFLRKTLGENRTTKIRDDLRRRITEGVPIIIPAIRNSMKETMTIMTMAPRRAADGVVVAAAEEGEEGDAERAGDEDAVVGGAEEDAAE